MIGPCELYLGDCMKAPPHLLCADIVLTDPPYGIGYKVNARTPRGSKLKGTPETATDAKPMIVGDDRPFDPAPWLPVSDRVAFFGADNFMRRLPRGGRFIVWDKRRDSTPDDHSDGELVWLSRPGVLRIHRQKWRGVVREGEENCSRSKKLHPNQKPVALLDFILEQLGCAPGEIVVDPFMGSGSAAIAAMRKDMKFIGCEIDPEHFATACRRIEAELQQRSEAR